MVIAEKDVERFMSKIDKSSACWIWNAGLDHAGYGKIRIKGKMMFAHRLSWIIHNGEIPNKMGVCHSCDVRKCANPKHLFLGTQKENLDDMKKKGRGAIRTGELNNSSKLTEGDVRNIIQKIHKGEKITNLAKEFNVTHQTISLIKTKKTWTHLNSDLTT